MQTVIGQFATAKEADSAIDELSSYHLGETQAAVKNEHGHIQEREVGSNTTWDNMVILGILGCMALFGLIGLLAGLGVFGHMGGSAVSWRTALAGLLVGGGLGGIVGCIVGPFIGELEPLRQEHFHPTRVQTNGIFVAVTTQDNWTRDAVNIMRNAHAVNVATRKGKVDANQFAANMPAETKSTTKA